MRSLIVEESAQPPRRRRRTQAQVAPVVGAIVLASLGALLLAADLQIIPTGVGLRSSTRSMGRWLADSPRLVRRDTSSAARRHIKAPVPKPSRSHRRMSLALSNGDCVIKPALKPTRPLAPTFTASYPGSGAKMTWNLVQALTGIVTGDEHRHNQQAWSEAVTVKAHHPHIQGSPAVAETTNEDFPRVVLILRHPADAIPAFHNFLYEYERGLPDHSTRAPLSAWLEWRDDNFAEQIQAWQDHLSYWMERYSDPADRLIITFEGMIDDTWGPHVAVALNQFLRLTPGVDPIVDESVECVWKKIVQYKVVARPKPSAMSIVAPSEPAPLLSDPHPDSSRPTPPAIEEDEIGLDSAPAEEKQERQQQQQEEETASFAFTTEEPDPEPEQDPPSTPVDQHRRRLDATPDNPDSHRTGFKKERPYTPGQLALMQETFDRLRKRFQDPDLNDVLDLYSERVGLLQRHSVGIGFEPHRSGGEQEQQHTGKDAKVPTTGASHHPEEEAFTQPDLDLPGKQHGLLVVRD